MRLMKLRASKIMNVCLSPPVQCRADYRRWPARMDLSRSPVCGDHSRHKVPESSLRSARRSDGARRTPATCWWPHRPNGCSDDDWWSDADWWQDEGDWEMRRADRTCSMSYDLRIGWGRCWGCCSDANTWFRCVPHWAAAIDWRLNSKRACGSNRWFESI